MDTKKLRQKILDLAIRGKLVPQDPNDEPASVLLERIKAEKERLIKEGKIKRSKKIAKTSDTPHYENVPFEVPEGWVWTTVDELCDVVRGGSPRPAGDEKYYNGAIPFLKVADLTRDDGIYVYKSEHTIKEAGLKKTRLVNEGTLLLTNSGATLGVPKITTFSTTFNDGIAAFLYINKEIQLYLYWFLKSKTDSFRKIDQGAAQPNLNTDLIKSMLIPLPPLTEQKRIIKEIERCFSLINQIDQNKSDLQTIIKQTKSKILDLAIHGKLVPQDPNDEPASELLKRINPDFTPCDNAHSEKLPEGWCICKLENIAKILDNLRKPISSNERNLRIANKPKEDLYPYYGATGLVGMIDDYILNGKFLLLGEDGTPFLDRDANKAYVITGKCWVNNHAHILLPQCDFDYLMYYLNQIDFSNYVNGSTRLKLTQADMRSILVVLPPFAEQQRIVKKIEEQFFYLNIIQKALET